MDDKSFWARIVEERLSRRRLIAVSGAIAGTALLAGCGGGGKGTGGLTASSGKLTKPADTSKQAVRGGTVKDSRNADISNFDPHNTQSGGGSTGTLHYYLQTGGLFLRQAPGYLEPASWEITGDLAEAWEWSPDRLKLTMKIRPFGWAPMPPVNGRPITMDDIQWTMNRFFKEGSNRSDYLNSLNPQAPVLNIEYPDSKTMVWNLKFPLPSLLAIMASTHKQSYLMPVEAEHYDIKSTPACCGAFYLADYKPSVSFFLKRNPNWWGKDRVYLNAIDLPIISEYAQSLAQFRAGNLYRMTGNPIKQEDLLQTKQDVPQLLMYQTDFASSGASMAPGWKASPAEKTPFRDERVRLAYSMSIDRDTYLDAFNNISNLRSEGLPIETRWNTSLVATWTGFWIDPKDSKSFGPNAVYYQHNIAEAKKLLAAAGYPNGLDVVATYPTQIYGPQHVRSAEALIGLAQDAGFRISTRIAGDFNEWPPYRDGQGNFEGIAYRVYGSSTQADPVEQLVAEMTPGAGNLAFSGFDSEGKGTFTGDPTLTDMVFKARLEFDAEKRRDQVKEIQRYWAKHMYTLREPGAATGFELTWPAVKNERVYQGGTFGDRDLWLDPNEAPLKKG